jgi:CheY-like chemotaxis protein
MLTDAVGRRLAMQPFGQRPDVDFDARPFEWHRRGIATKAALAAMSTRDIGRLNGGESKNTVIGLFVEAELVRCLGKPILSRRHWPKDTLGRPVLVSLGVWGPVSEKPKILILEDDVLVACSLREVLSLVGYKVTGIAATVSDALCLAEKTVPDLAIVDVRLPGNRDGIEGAELLQQQFGMRVIFLTGEIDKATAFRAAKIDPAGTLSTLNGTPE